MRRRTLLLFAYLFPPEPDVGGVRPAGLAKYLPDFEWETIVIAGGSNPGSETSEGSVVIRLPTTSKVREFKRTVGVGGHILQQLDPNPPTATARFRTRVYRAASEVAALYPDSLPWLLRARRAALEICRTRPVDAILSTSKPEATHLAAFSVARRFRLPWVADFRDPWTTNYAYSYNAVRRAGERRLERAILAPADVLTTVSSGFATLLREIHPEKAIAVIGNGFDLDLLAPDDVALDPKLSIVYTGRLYRQQRIELVFEALRSLIDSGQINLSHLELRIYGERNARVDELSNRFDLTSCVSQMGVVPRSVAIEAQRRAQILLLPRWENGSASGVLAGKLFEYLAARRPILAPGTNHDATESLLESAHAGGATSTVADTEAFLTRSYDEFIHFGKVTYNASLKELERFSHRVMAQKFAEQLALFCRR